MWRCREAELNCVRRKIRRKPELMQLEMGMSTSRYLPPSGTAGLARSLVSGKSLVPRPPPKITESTLWVPNRVNKGGVAVMRTCLNLAYPDLPALGEKPTYQRRQETAKPSMRSSIVSAKDEPMQWLER